MQEALDVLSLNFLPNIEEKAIKSRQTFCKKEHEGSGNVGDGCKLIKLLLWFRVCVFHSPAFAIVSQDHTMTASCWWAAANYLEESIGLSRDVHK